MDLFYLKLLLTSTPLSLSCSVYDIVCLILHISWNTGSNTAKCSWIYGCKCCASLKSTLSKFYFAITISVYTFGSFGVFRNLQIKRSFSSFHNLHMSLYLSEINQKFSDQQRPNKHVSTLLSCISQQEWQSCVTELL